MSGVPSAGFSTASYRIELCQRQSAITGQFGRVEPGDGSTKNASALDFPISRMTAVVDGATALASIVPANFAPLSPISHI